MSIGTLIASALGGGRPLTGLTGGPLSLPANQQGGGPQQGAQGQPAVPPGASGTPSAAPQSPPDLQQAYLQLMRQQMAAQTIDRSLAGLAASFSTPSMRASLMGSVPEQPDMGAMLQNLLQLQQYQRQQQGFNQLMAGNAQLSQISGIPESTLQGLAMMNPAEYAKIVETYGGIGGGADQDYMRGMAKARVAHPGASTQQIMQNEPWLTNATTFNKTTQDAAEAKSNAMESYPKLNQVSTDSVNRINWLADPTNRSAVEFAVAHPDLTDANKLGGWLKLAGPNAMAAAGTTDQILQARNYINWLKSNLQTEEFVGTKNVRSTTEFKNLGATATNLDQNTNNAETIGTELDRLQHNAWTADANLEAEAGKSVDAKYAGLADRNYFNPEHPFYNGATEGKLKPPPSDLVQEAKAGIAKNPLNRNSYKMQFREMGYDPSGL